MGPPCSATAEWKTALYDDNFCSRKRDGVIGCLNRWRKRGADPMKKHNQGVRETDAGHQEEHTQWGKVIDVRISAK